MNKKLLKSWLSSSIIYDRVYAILDSVLCQSDFKNNGR